MRITTELRPEARSSAVRHTSSYISGSRQSMVVSIFSKHDMITRQYLDNQDAETRSGRSAILEG